MDENLLEAFSVGEDISQPTKTVHTYQSRLKYMLDKEVKIIDTLVKGKKEGLTEGFIEGFSEGFKIGFKMGIEKVAKNMIAKGISNEEISDVTELTIEEVEALRVSK